MKFTEEYLMEIIKEESVKLLTERIPVLDADPAKVHQITRSQLGRGMQVHRDPGAADFPHPEEGNIQADAETLPSEVYGDEDLLNDFDAVIENLDTARDFVQDAVTAGGQLGGGPAVREDISRAITVLQAIVDRLGELEA